MTMYSLQVDRNDNRIVCRGSVVRAGTYRVVYVGTYADCSRLKLDAGARFEVAK